MLLSDIVEDVKKRSIFPSGWRVLLATKEAEGQPLEDGSVRVFEIGELSVDQSSEEIDLYPTALSRSEKSSHTLSDVLAFADSSPELLGFSLSGVTAVKRLADGGQAVKSSSVVGSYIDTTDQEYLLLLSPESQWPSSWFGT